MLLAPPHPTARPVLGAGTLSARASDRLVGCRPQGRGELQHSLEVGRMSLGAEWVGGNAERRVWCGLRTPAFCSEKGVGSRGPSLATSPGGPEGVAGHLPSHPLPLAGKREWQEAPASASRPRRKARDTCWGCRLLPGRGRELLSRAAACPPLREGALGTGRCLPRLPEAESRS